MAEFEDVWASLVEHARDMAVVETFDRGSENDVEYDPRDDAIRFYSRQTNSDFWTAIPREQWRAAWTELRREGELTPDRFRDVTGTRRGSIAVPFLRDALDLPANEGARTIYPSEAD